MTIVSGDKEYFKGVPKIQFEGPGSDNPFAFKHYDANKIIGDKTMEEHFRFAVAWWHSFGGNGADPFGAPTKYFPWNAHKDVLSRAKSKMDAGFEFITKLGIPFYCFHDFDLIEEGSSLQESEKRLELISDYALEKQKASGVKVLWGTANLFSHPRYMNGAATNPDFNVVAHAGAQVKQALDVTIKLGGENYVFWGGREGYMSLLNTDMKRELGHMARFLHMTKDYARAQGFKGTFLIEPKPAEPSKHQYDFDAATVIGFLRAYDLMDDFKLNIEVNHATLAQHTFEHEMQVAANDNMLGSMDANRGDYQNGWDTDQFPNNVNELTEAFLIILRAGGFQGGGINFDSKTRRNSTDLEDLFYGHIGGMDTFAKALTLAHAIIESGEIERLRAKRYASFESGQGQAFATGHLSLEDLQKLAVQNGEPSMKSGQQELYENIVNRFI